MFDDILLPVDGRTEADPAVEHAADVAGRFDATIHVLFVANTNRESVTVVGTEVVDALEREGRDVVEPVADDLRDRGVDCRTDVVQGGPAQTIADYAEQRGMDLVVMPTGGRSDLADYLLGSVTEKVVRHSTVPVLTVRTHGDVRTTFPYEDVLVPTDGSDDANAALDRAVELADGLDATLHAVSVVDEASLGFDVRSETLGDEFEELASEAVTAAADTARDAGVENVVESVRRGKVHRELLGYAEDNDVDVVVVGATGRGVTERVLLGSVTDRLVRSSPVPVMTVRR